MLSTAPAAARTRAAPAARLGWIDLGLAGVAFAIAAGYLVLGLGHVMDDWYTLNHAHFDGAWRAAGTDQLTARPMASLVYAAIFGLLDGAVVPATLLMAASNAASAMFLRRLVGLFAPASIALGAALAWLVLPTTTSLEAWASAANISLALALALGTLWLAARARSGRVTVVAVATSAAAAVLSYEAVLVLLIPVALGLLVFDRERDGRSCTAVIVGAAAAFAWMVLHWHPNKRVTSFWGDVTQVIPANFTWGIGTGMLGYVAGLVVLVMTVAVVAPSLRHHPRLAAARAPMAVGWTILWLGVVPFLKYTYAPIGAGDRANVVSSLGGALVVATTVWLIAGIAPRWVGPAVVMVGLATAFQPRWLMMQSWSLAGDDARAIEEAVRRLPSQPEVVVLGPRRVDRNGVTAMQHPDIFEDAVQLILDDATIRGSLSTSVEEFRAAAGAKVDVRRIIDDPDAPGDR